MTEMQEPIRTFNDARKVGAYGLARRWIDQDSPQGPLEELATMAALADRLTAWLPLQAHRSALAGATRVDIAAAMGVTVDDLRIRWTEWVQGQRELYDYFKDRRLATPDQKPTGVSPEEYAQVAALLGPVEEISRSVSQ